MVMLSRYIQISGVIQLGSVITTVLVLGLFIEVAVFYTILVERLEDTRDYQVDNRRSIDRLVDDLDGYKKWATASAMDLTKQVDSLREDVNKLKQDVPRKGR